MARPETTFEQAKKILYKTHGDKINILEFHKYGEDGKLKCNICEHIWIAQISRVARKTGCPNCQLINDKLSYSYVKEQIEKQSCQLLSKDYINAKEKLEILFPCGHNGYINYNSFQQGKRCAICGIKIRSDSHKTKKEKIIKFLKDKGFSFISFDGEYKTQKTTLVFYSCSFGHVTRREVDRIFSYPTCAECKILKLSDIHKGKNNPQWKGGVTSLRAFCSNLLGEWKRDSMEDSNYECPITGLKDGWEIHHIYSFGKIINESLNNLNLPVYESMEKYTNEEQVALANEIIRLHKIYPLGVCLDKNVHKLFHSIYGRGNTVPKDWDNFISSINSGKIKVI